MQRTDCAFRVRRVSCDSLPPHNELTRPYDLNSDEVLFRAEIYETRDGSFFYLDMHHIVSDGESEAILLRDINRAYSGEEISREEYTGYEYALDEEASRKSERLEKAGAFYHSIFAGCGGETLPVRDRRDEAYGKESEASHIASWCLTGEVDADAIRSFCREHSLTLNSFLTTAFAVTLKSYTASEQAVFTTIYNGRNDPRTADSVAMFVKTFPVLTVFHSYHNPFVCSECSVTDKASLPETDGEGKKNDSSDLYENTSVALITEGSAAILFGNEP